MYYYHTFWKYCSISFIIIVLTLQLLQCSTNKEKFTSSNFSWKLRRVTTPIDLQTGLMNVKHLNNNYGMLFDFGKNDYHYLWMKNTLIPLDAIFLDSQYKIIDWIDNMPPHSLQSRGINLPSRYIVEIGGGLRRKHNLKKGDTFNFTEIE